MNSEEASNFINEVLKCSNHNKPFGYIWISDEDRQRLILKLLKETSVIDKVLLGET